MGGILLARQFMHLVVFFADLLLLNTDSYYSVSLSVIINDNCL